ncbi:FAD-dependent oxidoreductase [uncultured Vagococcus sp.]|uniref:NAD(P)/FAD-dependent oxidoreductase n=1 Tax=uncultured Vagococcus sp. TaxID=189676 RepID=UPI0028D5955F|nr:FAD-dependent oxidoreductase [uncultured Vagococcus sp.]
MTVVYDVIIIGGGPAGLTAALYNSRARLKTLVLEREKLGGQIMSTHEIANFPGSILGKAGEPSGSELIARMIEQAQKYGATIEVGKEVVGIEVSDSGKVLTCKDGSVYQSTAIIAANGAVPRKIGCPGEAELQGKGVSYCATCDGAFFEELEVYVIGGGNSAVEEATFLTSFARKVTIIQNLGYLTADAIAIEQAEKTGKIEVIYHSVVEEIIGDGLVESMIIRNTETEERLVIKADEEDGTFGVFVFIGYQPSTALYQRELDLNEWGYIETTEAMATNVPGIFAAGDIRPKLLRQVVTATGDGATAAFAVQRYIEAKK